MDYVRVLSDLISIDTSVPPGSNYEKALAYLDPLFRETGFKTEMIPIPAQHAEGLEGRVNLLAHRRSPGKPRLIFYGHVDVVPAQGWPAFKPRIENGRIYGRGAADMKGGIAALLLGLDKVKHTALKYDTSVMITTDEEIGQASQIRFLGQFLEPVSGAYLFDLDSSFGIVTIASLGAVQMDIRVKGKSVHSALSHLGDNAVEKASLLVNALLDLKKQIVLRKSRIDAEPDSGLGKMEARLNINVIKGGLKANIVPDECVITVDRRLVPEEDIDQAKQEIIDCLSSVKEVQWSIENVFPIPTVPVLDDPVVDELSGIIREVNGKSGKYGQMGSGDFGPVVSLEWKARSFGSGVIRSDNSIHGKDEFVYMKDIESLAEVISRFVAEP